MIPGRDKMGRYFEDLAIAVLIAAVIGFGLYLEWIIPWFQAVLA